MSGSFAILNLDRVPPFLFYQSEISVISEISVNYMDTFILLDVQTCDQILN